MNWFVNFKIQRFSSILYTREQHSDTLNAHCFSYCKEGNHRTIHDCIQLCKQRLEHIQNGNAAYSLQMGEDVYPLYDGRSDNV